MRIYFLIMRKLSLLDTLFPKVRQGILAATLLHPERWWYLSDLARHLQVAPSSLQRELYSLVDAGILDRCREGRQVYFRPNPDCPILPELQGILIKTTGLVDQLRQTLAPFSSQVDCAFVYGSIARGQDLSDSDVDLLVVGRLGLADLAPALTQLEDQLGRPVNPILFTREEFVRKRNNGHPFLAQVLQEDKLFVVGNLHELEPTADQLARAIAHTD